MVLICFSEMSRGNHDRQGERKATARRSVVMFRSDLVEGIGKKSYYALVRFGGITVIVLAGGVLCCGVGNEGGRVGSKEGIIGEVRHRRNEKRLSSSFASVLRALYLGYVTIHDMFNTGGRH